MARALKILVSWWMAASLTLLFSACGGGGSGSNAGIPVDPAASYTGVTTQAAVSQGNAEALAIGGFSGGKIGSVVVTAKSVTDVDAAEGPVRNLTQVIKQSTRRMGIPQQAKRLMKTDRFSASVKVIRRAESFQVPGDAGGYASFAVDINDATGSFSGSIVFHDYASQGIVLSGTADILGTFDANYQDFSRLTLSFKSLSMNNGSVAVTLIGSLSWGFNFSASVEALTINMVLVDRTNSKTYWFRNYELVTTYGSGSQTQTLSGRYYDPDHGYVDFVTETPLVAKYGTKWPAQGALKFSGRGDSWVRLGFLARKLLIEADTNGDSIGDWQTERATNGQTDYNSPPTAEAGPGQNVIQGTTVAFDGTASLDPDGDPLSYSWTFESCPQNACPGLTGSNTATPSFVAERTGSYVLRLTVFDGQAASPPDTVSVTTTPAAPSDPSLLQQQWEYGTYGTYIGRAGLLVFDLDGDGTPEVIASASVGGFGSNSLWYVMRQQPDGTYAQVWRSENYAVTVVRLALADLSGDGKDDVIVALSDGSIRIYDGPTLKELRKVTAAANLTAMAVADLDGDGKKELVTSDGIKVFVYSTETGMLKWSSPTGGGSSIAVGNVDGDPALEIVTTATGGKGYVIDGVSGSIEWEYVNSFGAQVGLGDLDGDGMQEIVGASGWDKITIFDADRKTPVWEIVTSHDIGTLLVADADGDGVPEIIYGDGQWGQIHAIDARSHVQKWSVNNPDHGVSGVALGDVDRDGTKELLWGAGGSSTGADHLSVADPSSGTVEWKSMHVDGPLSAVAVGDVDDDGEDEIVMISFESDSGYAEGIIHIFNARTHALEFQQKLGIMDWMGVRSVKIGDVDGDGRTEFVVTTGNIYDGVIRVYDGATHALKRQSAGYSGNFFTALAIGDVDGDGKTEIVAGQGREHTGAQGVFLIVFDGATLQEKWRSVDLGSYWGGVYDIKLADLDGDGHTEIVVSVSGNRLLVYDGVNHDLKLMIEHKSRALDIADIDGDGMREILAGRDDGRIDVFDGKSFALKKTVSSFGTSPVDALRVADLDGNGTGEWLVASGGALTILEGQGQGLKWRSRYLSGNLGAYSHIAVRDTDGDGRKEIVLGSDLALYQFE
jgi:K319-like protein/VCBS repeat protein